jgi:hypothetical protein
LKGSATDSIHDLATGGSVDWLGYTVSLKPGSPVVEIAERAWQILAMRLAAAHLKPDSPIRAAQIIQGWLAYRGPCFPFPDQLLVVRRVRQIAAEQAFDEVPHETRLIEIWNAAHARWHRVFDQELLLLEDRLKSIAKP